MARIVIGLIVLGLLGYGLLVLATRAQPATVVRVVRYGGAAVLTLFGVLMLLLGRIAFAFMAGAGALALVRGQIPGMGAAPFGGGRRPASGQSSAVETEWLAMTLDHDTGAMEGTVRAGVHMGRTLDDMALAELLELRGELAGHEQSRALLDAWLDRRFGPDWRDGVADDDAGEASDSGRSAPGGGPGGMSRAEAFAILGLDEGADEGAIRSAYRRLMRTNHPDRGGSAWLAARINAARDRLLGKS